VLFLYAFCSASGGVQAHTHWRLFPSSACLVGETNSSSEVQMAMSEESFTFLLF